MARLGPGALVWAGFDGPQVPPALLDALRDGRVGGLILFSARGNVRSKDQLRAMLVEAQAAARRGGLPAVPVAVDQEGGSVVRVAHRAVFPSAMAIAATGDPGYAEGAARAVAEGLRADGITVDHAPVCDVNVEPRNPVIGVRSFGDDPERVADFAGAWVRGSEGAGVASSAKHFPGHGSTAYDSHLTTQDVRDDAATLRRRDLVPFAAAIRAGASTVMAAHIRYPALDADEIATFSRRILVDLLRGELGFDGLALSDALGMSGVTLVEVPERIVSRAVAAGIDAVLLDRDLRLQLDASEAIAVGVPPARVAAATRRVARFRERFGGSAPTELDDAPARGLAAEIAARSITHAGPPLPRLDGRVRVTIMSPRHESPVEEMLLPPDALELSLRRRLGDRLAFERGGREPEGDGVLVVCTENAWHDAEQAQRAAQLLANGGIVCALRSPYDVTLFRDRPALLTYGDVPASLDALAAVLAGEAAARGVLPVRLP
ncbi:MAG: glycoside hydrolase family 3 protein [Chloroflexota bacterium]|nr:glycoside hydrolase family 3 protein [Chloroflexota bacterium]